MENTNFDLWCQNATKDIRYGPDRRLVAEELHAHLEDHYDALRAEGVPHSDAISQALRAMGSAEEIRPQLAAVHKPFLGYLYAVVKYLAVVTAAFTLFLLTITAGSTLSKLIQTRNFDSLPVNEGPLDYYCQPNVSDWSDGYRFQITEAGYSAKASTFYFELEILNWPWMDACAAGSWIWAIDSRGRYYSPQADTYSNGLGSVSTGGSTSTNFISVTRYSLSIFDPSAEWVEIHYDRDGRDMVLRIDLTGGGDK